MAAKEAAEHIINACAALEMKHIDSATEFSYFFAQAPNDPTKVVCVLCGAFLD